MQSLPPAAAGTSIALLWGAESADDDDPDPDPDGVEARRWLRETDVARYWRTETGALVEVRHSRLCPPLRGNKERKKKRKKSTNKGRRTEMGKFTHESSRRLRRIKGLSSSLISIALSSQLLAKGCARATNKTKKKRTKKPHLMA